MSINVDKLAKYFYILPITYYKGNVNYKYKTRMRKNKKIILIRKFVRSYQLSGL